MLEKKLALIRKYDPNSIVVIQGDHGPALRGDCLQGLKTMSLMRLQNYLCVTRFGTLIAIHWPDKYKAAKYDKNLLINQNIFPVIFSYLYDSPKPLVVTAKAYSKIERQNDKEWKIFVECTSNLNVIFQN